MYRDRSRARRQASTTAAVWSDQREGMRLPASDESLALARAAAEAADDVKATDLVIIEVADVLAIADVFLLATAGSDRQLKAVAERIEERLRDDERRPLRREGSPAAGWVLLDFGDVVCHLFAPEQRDTYALERLWADVPQREALTGRELSVGHSAPAEWGAAVSAPRSETP